MYYVTHVSNLFFFTLSKVSRNGPEPLKSLRLTTTPPWCCGSQQTPSLHAATPLKEKPKVSPVTFLFFHQFSSEQVVKCITMNWSEGGFAGFETTFLFRIIDSTLVVAVFEKLQ